MDSAEYAQWFRASTPYIRAHRAKTFVVTLDADALGSDNAINIVHDLALLHVLGVRLVIVFGIEPHDSIVDASVMDELLDRTGRQRAGLEALFSTGIPASNLRNRHIPLVSGNFVTAKPVGIVDGVDQLHSGAVRRIHGSEIAALLDASNLVLMTPIGFSTAGVAYHLDTEDLAVETAVTLQADKLIVFDELDRVVDANGHEQSDLTAAELQDLIGAVAHDSQLSRRLRALVHACRRGIQRSHLISYRADGALLQELFTPDGVGTQVSEDDYRSIRRATTDDMGAIVELIRPYEMDGSLVPRPRDRLEEEIDRFWVAELDGLLIGCCALYPFEEGFFELGCVVSAQAYRSNALGQRLLRAAQNAARDEGATSLFVLTTRAADWFADNGFVAASIDALPESKKAMYNQQRNSKVLIKRL